MNKPIKHADFSREELIKNCRIWAEEIKLDHLDTAKLSYTETIVLTDELTYPIRIQDWIELKGNEDFRSIIVQANEINLKPNLTSNWAKLFKMIDSLKIGTKSEKKDNTNSSYKPYEHPEDIYDYLFKIEPSNSLQSVNESKSKLHLFARREVIAHCKAWADNARFEYLEIVTGDKQYAQHSTNTLTYPISIQSWIDWHNEPLLSQILTLTEEIDQNHTNPAKWEKLIKLIDAL